MTDLILTLLPELLAVCRTDPDESFPDWLPSSGFWSLTKTAEELSLVIDEHLAPSGWQVEKGWRGLKVEGPLDFSLVGILSALTGPLAAAGIPVFALSTYETDYLLIKQHYLQDALTVLAEHDFVLRQ